MKYIFLEELIDEMTSKIKDYIEDECEEVTHQQIGIDERSYGKIWVNRDGNLITQNVSEYYSGLSYVSSEHKLKIGSYIIYSCESDRVAEHLENYYGNN
jgi:isoaspartyl peptidase/L-asparaginase-like protein (Ntn-hydrolase superfamily)